MNKEPVRLYKNANNDVSPLFDLENWVLLHPVTLLIAIIIGIVIVSSLVFAVTGHAALESGGMRNFIATGA